MVVVHRQPPTRGIWLLANCAHRLLVGEHLLVQLPCHSHDPVPSPSILGSGMRVRFMPCCRPCFMARLTVFVVGRSACVLVELVLRLILIALYADCHRERLPHRVAPFLADIIPQRQRPPERGSLCGEPGEDYTPSSASRRARNRSLASAMERGVLFSPWLDGEPVTCVGVAGNFSPLARTSAT